ncbi:alpha/beta hydrolase [Actinomadura sp. DC4]|uniref:alpha/beta hydrolase n=1 Tax=Actinomadura sp. DC4 TaxID=3055069 RepID=UPI0025B1E706|nr:alpha/beta hydrolase [Actinomadura sp. DC4]MDN3355861.1 alpha/beta hydrolase [Actinomadura sp. DC4]
MPLHPQAVAFLKLMDTGAAPAEPDVEAMRAGTRANPYRGVGPDLAETEDGAVGDVPIRIYRPESGTLPALVYFHGGGWAIGDLDTADPMCRRLAAEAGCAVVSVGYRLAPEDPFPAAVEDAYAVTADVAGNTGRYGVRPGAVAVAGDSAGGNLAAVTALRARDEGLPLAHQLLMCPNTDSALDSASFAEFGEGYGLSAATMAWFFGHYIGYADRFDPRVAPLRAADLSGLPPATVLTAEYDILRDEGEEYARALEAAGVPVELRRHDGMIHNFVTSPEVFDDAVTAREWAASRLRQAFDREQR